MSDSDNKHDRSEGLLPAEDDDDDNDSFDVAEEMNLDQQSNKVRHLGNFPEDEDKEAAAVAETLRPKQ